MKLNWKIHCVVLELPDLPGGQYFAKQMFHAIEPLFSLTVRDIQPRFISSPVDKNCRL